MTYFVQYTCIALLAAALLTGCDTVDPSSEEAGRTEKTSGGATPSFPEWVAPPALSDSLRYRVKVREVDAAGRLVALVTVDGRWASAFHIPGVESPAYERETRGDTLIFRTGRLEILHYPVSDFGS